MLTDQDNAIIAELAPNGILVVRGSDARIKEIACAVFAKLGDNTIAEGAQAVQSVWSPIIHSTKAGCSFKPRFLPSSRPNKAFTGTFSMFPVSL